MIKRYDEMVDLIDTVKYCYIGSVDAEGRPNIKAMTAPRKRDGINTFYLPSQTLSVHVAQYRQHHEASIYFSSSRRFEGLLLTGRMDIIEDADTKEKFWVEEDAHLYPAGVGDENFCILKFTAYHARYFDGKTSEDIQIK